MKKTLLTLIVMLTISVTSFSQVFFDFGPKVLVGPSLMNSNVSFDTTSGYKHKFNSFGYGLGLKFALNFNEQVSTVGEFIWTNNTENMLVNGVEKQIISKGYEIPLMLRHNNENFGYIEGGVVFVKTNSVMETVNNVSIDNTLLYSTKNTGLVLGFGGYLFGSSNLGVSAGLRFRYNLSDEVNSDNPKFNNNSVYALDENVESTHNISAMFVLELNYDLGFTMARSPCGHRRKLLLSPGHR